MVETVNKWSRKKKVIFTICITIVVIIALGAAFIFYYPFGTYRDAHVNGNSGIAAHPQAAVYNKGKLAQLPAYNPENGSDWQVDVRSSDLSDLDLSQRGKDLMYADFDSKTVWPSSLPTGFNPNLIMDIGKNPGLNLRKLHQQGITGKGVSIAVIDQMLLTDHMEYGDRLKFYEELHASDEGGSSMHGPAVSSIAVGKNVGVAPEANLYYIAEAHGSFTLAGIFWRDKGFNWDFTYLAKAINRILDVNETLPQAQKIRAISISVGWVWHKTDLKEMDQAMNRAKSQGVLVLSTEPERYYNFNLWGLGRDPLSDPDNVNSYTPGLFWQKNFFIHPDAYDPGKSIMVPMDSRCTAGPTGTADYAYYRSGGLSWAVPYLTGMYALCCQVKPDITPEQFIKEAIATGDVITINKDDKSYRLGTVINPQRLLEKLPHN